MKCLQCRNKITSANKQKYVLNLPIPYCKNCTDAYNSSDEDKEEIVNSRFGKKQIKAFKKMNVAQRNTVREKLLSQGYSEKEVDQAFKIMRSS